MTEPVAALPMHDWPELRGATDALWAVLRDALRGRGIPAPEVLTRSEDHEAAWLHPGLVLAQTCGLPFVQRLEGRVTLLGAPDQAVPGCPPGWYRSAVVVRAGDPREELASFRGAAFALNGWGSQSGYAAMLHHLAPLTEQGRFFGTTVLTGAHADSALTVARGAADIAALDHVSWRFIQRFVPEAAGLRVLLLTEPTPGLPYIAAQGTEPGRHRGAIAEAVSALDPASAEALGLAGFVAFEPADYALLRERLAAAEARVRLPAARARPG
ncbi:MAG TPA: PhnD/SsuA/transferrin family substrate-binding protein [Paracoccaceae bacterium]|nr:PhnD/SsuA/transferrin family substrate-binding protein [Paracoccaceae bacterium]